jgi:hypothetical protein
MKIQSITEAFSMQPTSLVVVSEPNNTIQKTFCIKRIEKAEVLIMVNGEYKAHGIYWGFNWNEECIFQYLENSVNVHYINE